jgi:hypothetical protein
MATDQPVDKQIAAGQRGCDPRDQSSGIDAEPLRCYDKTGDSGDSSW